MSPVALSALLAAAAAAVTGAYAQTTTSIVPLVEHTYAYGQQPYQVEPTGDIRGNQEGYNICNSTTQNQGSLCQTLIVNTIDDFCLWSSPTPNNTIGDSEAYEVAWCSKSGHGTRIMPEGTLQGVQYLVTSQYIMIVGFIDQTKMNLQASDEGGELDPHGADMLGNPMGALVYSNQYPTGNTNNNSLTQVIEWTEFIGSDTFCIKICNPAVTDANNVGLCQNVYDEVGINYNCPNMARNGTYEVCDADPMSPVGQYTSAGETLTWVQPWSGVVSPPYTPTVPASSNCRTFASTALYTDIVQATSAASSGASATAAPTGASGSGSNGVASGATRTGASSSVAATGAASNTNGAGAIRTSALATLAGVAFAVVFLA